jgi:LmbE family N-acetylglucosaminyl deacetylase
MAVRPRLQVVVAHPDDETFSCGSLLLHAAAGGATTAVCCATRGEAGGAGTDLGTVRERELRRAAAILGVDRVDLLGFVDSGMSGDAGPDTVVGAAVERLLAAVQGAVAAFRPDASSPSMPATATGTVYARRVRPAWTGGATETRLFPAALDDECGPR